MHAMAEHFAITKVVCRFDTCRGYVIGGIHVTHMHIHTILGPYYINILIIVTISKYKYSYTITRSKLLSGESHLELMVRNILCI